MRQAARWFQNSQTSSVGDLLKWSLRGENRAIQETAAQLVELNMVWSDVQKSFCGNATHIPYPHLYMNYFYLFHFRSTQRLQAAV